MGQPSAGPKGPSAFRGRLAFGCCWGRRDGRQISRDKTCSEGTLLCSMTSLVNVSAMTYLRNWCLRVGLAHVDVHGVGVSRKLWLSHELCLVGCLRDHVPSVSSQHTLCWSHSRWRHVHLFKSDKQDKRFMSRKQICADIY